MAVWTLGGQVLVSKFSERKIRWDKIISNHWKITGKYKRWTWTRCKESLRKTTLSWKAFWKSTVSTAWSDVPGGFEIIFFPTFLTSCFPGCAHLLRSTGSSCVSSSLASSSALPASSPPSPFAASTQSEISNHPLKTALKSLLKVRFQTTHWKKHWKILCCLYSKWDSKPPIESSIEKSLPRYKRRIRRSNIKIVEAPVRALIPASLPPGSYALSNLSPLQLMISLKARSLLSLKFKV